MCLIMVLHCLGIHCSGKYLCCDKQTNNRVTSNLVQRTVLFLQSLHLFLSPKAPPGHPRLCPDAVRLEKKINAFIVFNFFDDLLQFNFKMADL